MADISTLVEDIYHVLDPTNDHVCDEKNLTQFGEAITAVVRDFLRTYDRKGGALRFSALGKPECQLYFDEHADPKEKEVIEGPAMYKFLYGHVIEALTIFLAKEAGHDVSDEQMEVEYDGVKGHIDCIIDGAVVDCKSTSPYAFKKFADGELQPEDDGFGYLHQLAGYASVLDRPGYFLAIEKVAGKLALSPVSQYTVKGYAPGPRIVHLRDVLQHGEPPARAFTDEPDGKSGNRKLGFKCSYCGWKAKCWPGLRGFAYSTGPRFLTDVKREPDVPEFPV